MKHLFYLTNIIHHFCHYCATCE